MDEPWMLKAHHDSPNIMKSLFQSENAVADIGIV